MGYPRIRYDMEIVLVDDRRRHVSCAAGRAPNNMSLGDIPNSVRTNGEDMVGREAGGNKKPSCSLIVNRRGNELFGRTLDHPVPFSIIGIVTGNTFVP